MNVNEILEQHAVTLANTNTLSDLAAMLDECDAENEAGIAMIRRAMDLKQGKLTARKATAKKYARVRC